MSDLFACTCGQHFQVRPESRGQQVRCPGCGRVAMIPAAVAQPAAGGLSVGWLVIAAVGIALTAGVGIGIAVLLNNRNDQRKPERQQTERDTSTREKSEQPPTPPKSSDKQNTPNTTETKPVVTPATADEQARILARINGYRTKAGLAPVALDGDLSRACESRLDSGGGGIIRIEVEPLAAVDQLIATSVQRLELLAPGLERIGLAAQHDDRGRWVSTFDLRTGRTAEPKQRDAAKPVVYPGNGQIDVPLAFPGNEIPDPVPEAIDKVVGYPITATFPARARLAEATGRLTDSVGVEVAAWFSSPEKPANPAFAPNQAHTLCIMPKKPLRPMTAYAVTFNAQVDGKPWSHTLSFTTGDPAREASSAKEHFLTQLNGWRRTAGLGALSFDENESRACQAHAEYLARNVKKPDVDLSAEQPDLPGFTPEGQRAGKLGQITVAPYPPEAMLDGWVAGFHYRFPVLDPDARALAFGCAHGPRNWFVVTLVQRGGGRREPFVYPADGQTNVPLYYEDGESPDPIPESKDRNAGFPITVMLPSQARVTAAKAELFHGEIAVPAWVSSPERPVAPGLQRNTICLIAKQPLEADTVYRAVVSAQVDGKSWEKAWSFRTAGDRPPDLMAMAGQVLARANYHRRHAGLMPVALDPGAADGCLAHARYLARNYGHPAVMGLGMHTEDPKLPGYSDLGKQTGQDSVIAMGMTPLLTVEEWMATLYHRIPLLDPNLGSIAFGYARGGNGGWMTVVNARAARGRPSVVVYPADGDGDVPVAGATSGFPITVQFPLSQLPRNVSMTLRNATGDVVPADLQNEKDAAVSLQPRQPLRASSRHAVELQADVDGKKHTWNWTFRTR